MKENMSARLGAEAQQDAKDYVLGEAEELHSIFNQSGCYIEFVERLRQAGYVIIKDQPQLMLPDLSPEELDRVVKDMKNRPYELVNVSNIKPVLPIDRNWMESNVPESMRINPEVGKNLVTYTKMVEREVLKRVNAAHDNPVVVSTEPVDIKSLIDKIVVPTQPDNDKAPPTPDYIL